MGWSCAADASRTMEKWVAACRAVTGSSNVFKIGDKFFFFESSNREHRDGAITGAIFWMLKGPGDGPARKVGSFKIRGDGSVAKAPSFLRAAS